MAQRGANVRSVSAFAASVRLNFSFVPSRCFGRKFSVYLFILLPNFAEANLPLNISVFVCFCSHDFSHRHVRPGDGQQHYVLCVPELPGVGTEGYVTVQAEDQADERGNHPTQIRFHPFCIGN